MKEINSEVINDFLTGFDPMERIVTLECGYGDDQVSIIYNNDIGEKRVKKENYYPFVWVKQSAAQRLFDGNRVELKKKMAEFGIRVKGLNIYNKDGKTAERLENGYRVMFYASKRMAYNKFLRFFQIAGMPVYPNDKDKDQKSSSKDFLAVSPIEQFMIQTGKRLFKGYDDYDELTRLEFDLETQGLEPKLHAIDQIGIRTNRGFEKILTITGEGNERRKNELIAIEEAIKIIADIKPDVITGHNSENFDWNYLIVRCDVLGSSMQEISSKYFKQALYKKKRQTVLKLGGEIEYYYPTVLWGYNITDSLHAIRRAQAQDSNMKKADLKYVTKYSKLNKPNRVYVPGDQIKKVWAITDPVYAFNNTNGLWYRITDEKPLQEGYEVTTGKYIVERYLLDDLYETDKVELRYNQSNFLLAKLLPTNFSKICTMGTAGTWKMIMLAWSYENDLAIPAFSTAKKFTGGLSRLLSVGYVDRIVKLDYNSLYPSIILTWDIASELDISGVMLQLLAYILDQREKFKGLKKKAKKHAEKLKEQEDIFQGTDEELRELMAEIQKWESEESANDKKQLPFKIFGNSFFGGFGAPDIFPWGDLICAEMTTCIGRQSLRLMIKWFSDRGYKPIVGDSFLYDTPLFVKYNDTDYIDILPISDIIDERNINIDGLGREYDYNEKPFKILCRSGWVDVKYIYRHKTDKEIHRIKTKSSLIDVTSDHSLFDSDKNQIHSKECIVNETKLEMYDGTELVFSDDCVNEIINEDKAWLMGFFLADGSSTFKERTQKYWSKRDNCFHYNKGIRCNWTLSKSKYEKLEKANKILFNEFNVVAKIHNFLKSSGVYKIQTDNSKLARWFSERFYTKKREKKVPLEILNSPKNIQIAFLNGFCYGDSDNDSLDGAFSFSQKSKTCVAGLTMLLKNNEMEYTFSDYLSRIHAINVRINEHKHAFLRSDYHLRKDDVVCENKVIPNYDKEKYVYDISLDGTVVNALGHNVAKQTDGFNFQMPSEEVLKTRIYIGKGLNREVKEGKEYHGVEADVAEFNDLFMRGKMGLGIDEYADATINFARKNYADLLAGGEIKLVGNTIKSKKMPTYIEKFVNEGVELLLKGDGQKFLENYYDYIEKIYNYKIPLRDIASKGKIKKPVKEYIEDCKTLTKAGRPKSRQAWYELVIREEVKVDVGDTIYYINTGKAKSHSDVKKVTTKDKIDKETGEIIEKGSVKIQLNCALLSNDIVEAEHDTFCDDNIEYNVPKYIDQFNKRITPLLVCFSSDIRNEILVKNPDDRKYWTKEQSILVSGQPNRVIDQDTYEQLLTMEDKEIKYWISVNKTPPFVEEIGINWKETVEDYQERMKELEREELKIIVEEYNKIIDELTKEDVEVFEEEGKLPKRLLDIVREDVFSTNLYAKDYDVVIGSLFDIRDKVFTDEAEVKYNEYVESYSE